MTREEYLKLINSFEGFKGFDPQLQENMLNATGTQMEKYAAILRNGQNMLVSAQQDLFTRNAAAMKNFHGEIKKIQKENNSLSEKVSVRSDENQQAQLLEQLKNI